MCAPGYGPDKRALLSKKERIEMHSCTNMCDLIDFVDEKIRGAGGRDAMRRDSGPRGGGGMTG